jgi:tetratricopeptide (TPR) repeat protein
MRIGFLAAAGAKLRSWSRQHPWSAFGALVLLIAVLSWAGYRAYGFFAARSHFRAAQQALDRREWSEARQHLEACLGSWPDSPDAHLLAARAARRLELLDEAQAHLDTCERLQDGPTQATRVELALLRVHRGDLAGAEQFLRSCVAQDDPDAVEILDVLSAALIIDYRVAEAHQCLDELLRRQPDNFAILVRRGWTAESQGWYTVAAESLQKALELRSEAHDVRLSLVYNLVTLGRYADALKHIAVLREEQTDNPAVDLALARCLAGNGQKKRAIQLLDQLLALEPNNWAALSERGWLGVQRDQPEDALAYLRLAQTLAPPNLTLLNRLADCLRLLGKEDEARQYRDKADQLRADTVLALRLSQRIREDRPNDPDLCHELGCVLLRLGKEQDAVHFFRKALEKDPKHRPSHESLAALRTKTGASGKTPDF